jgi:hypothetical protein
MIFGPPAFRDLCVVGQSGISNVDQANKFEAAIKAIYISGVLLTRWAGMISVCSPSHPTPSDCGCGIALVVQADYCCYLTLPGLAEVEAAEEPLLSSGRSGRLRMGEEGQSRRTACRGERAKGPLQRRCS